MAQNRSLHRQAVGARMSKNQPVEPDAPPDPRTKRIMIAIRRALLFIVSEIEKTYDIDPNERIVIIIER